MNDPAGDLGQQIDKLDRLLEKMPKYMPQNSVSNSSMTINGGGWINAIVMVLIGGMALAMFILFLSDRQAAIRERTELRAQNRADLQSLKADIKDLKDKSETQQAYINEVYRSLKK